jgi:hypothetical protein
MKTMTAFTELPPGFAFFAAILVYDLILLLRGELTLIGVDPCFETNMQETVQIYYEMVSQPETNPSESGFEMDGFAGGGETGWDLLFNWDFPDFS